MAQRSAHWLSKTREKRQNKGLRSGWRCFRPRVGYRSLGYSEGQVEAAVSVTLVFPPMETN